MLKNERLVLGRWGEPRCQGALQQFHQSKSLLLISPAFTTVGAVASDPWTTILDSLAPALRNAFYFHWRAQ
jgi:hypothetical protein